MAVAPLTNQEQGDLAERIRRREPSAENEFVRLFFDRIACLVLARTRDPEVAREVAQDVMLAVVRALRQGNLRADDRLAAFVYGTARNLINNHLRARSRQPIAEPLDSALQVASTAVEPDERVVLVRRALRTLDPPDRTILLLTLVDGLKPGEIAVRLGLTAEVVRARKSRALKKIIERVKTLS